MILPTKIATLLAVMLTCFAQYADAKKLQRIFVPGGTILLKGNKVEVQSFEISAYEITNERYAAFLNSKQIGADGRLKGVLLINVSSGGLQITYDLKKWVPKAGFGQHPMVMVNYYGAAAFCTWMGGKLPTEIQWLYAAQGGARTSSYDFAGSNDYAEVGWYTDNSAQHSHEVGLKKPNKLGIYDMSGNAWEWCLLDSVQTPGNFSVHMGGSWYAGKQAGRLDARYGNSPAHFSNSVGFRIVFSADDMLPDPRFFKAYQGKAWNSHLQQLPGRIQCEWYDVGGEGIAYHDKDSLNNGSGKLNPANGTFLNDFRMKEGVDISYTKARDIDNNPFNLVDPELDQLYTGWTMPGEWINYSIHVASEGTYIVGLMYTASGDGEIALMLDGKELTTDLFIPSTRHEQETIDWRNWHHWNKIDSLATIRLTRGRHILTLKTISNGNMNYDYLEFRMSR